ncbi:head-tail connector protein [Novosphingobium sp. AP12]|uniref:head-tail connector protein n=1 Tax=Novosphingobium sp. AP12 TaxID=1144305 RepID=UPI0002720AED|nr:head-tail connector protein [Novosphingobium sp. AP12]EJL25602.1 phage conserved hypothetical protein, gp8 family [Novosphingobium sp. AP12]
MIFELLHVPFPGGYGDAILPIEACKAHLRVDGEDEDDLIAALRDASIDFVERYCQIKLAPTEGIKWTAGGFPCSTAQALPLSVSPVRSITSIGWLDAAGAAVEGDVGNFRLTQRGDLAPAIGGSWPSGIGGGVSIVFAAGYDAEAAPPSLLVAVRMFLGHLYKNREAVTDRGTEAEVPFGVRQLCAPFRRMLI